MNKIIYVIIFLLCVSGVFGFADENTKITQLYFHGVQDTNIDNYTISINGFDTAMRTIKDLGYCSITFQDFYDFQDGKRQLCDRPIIIVFDDGFKSVYNNAYPIMKKYGFVGVFAVVTARQSVNPFYATWNQVRLLKINGWEIVSHSENHKNVRGMSLNDMRVDFNNSYEKIKLELGVSPSTYIFPYNGHNATSLNECLKVYRGCSSKWGYMMKNTMRSVGLYRIGTTNIHQSGNVVGYIKNLLPYKIVLVTNMTNNNVSVGVNLVKNSEFDFGGNFWNFYSDARSEATFNRNVFIVLISKGNNTQLFQKNIVLKKNTEYVLSFDGFSSLGSDLDVRLLKHTKPYTMYSSSMSFDLSNNWKKHTKVFKTNNYADSDARLMFWLVKGLSGEEYGIDNVTIVEKR